MDGGAISQAASQAEGLTGLRRRLVNDYQRDLPLVPQPFGVMAAELGWSEAAVIEALDSLTRDGVVTRVGPVIRPNTVGVSTLAAMAVPPERLETVAGMVSRRPEVNHNYEREHHFNLWLVVTARDARQLDAVVAGIEAASGLPVMVLPMLDDYYIDLGFDLDGRRAPNRKGNATLESAAVDATDRRLLQIVQDGLPLASRPFRQVGAVAGLPEREVIARLERLSGTGVIKRFGVIVRHHECGYRHNAMVVWDVPDDEVHVAGRRLAGMDAVRLCYRRPRRPPAWPYNLFCMIHGRERQAVLDEIARIESQTGMDRFSREILFSVRRFKQRGARYDFTSEAAAARSATA